ncbi:MAG: HPr family phosphocarrier protein [Succinatimonas sp.]|nr:HPr family phosphocarrier protein [Succinatimonas sp.]
MKRITYTVKDRDGMHARPAGAIIKAAGVFHSSIALIHKDRKVSLKGGIFGLLGLGIRHNDEIILEIDGDDELVASNAMIKALNDYL